MAKGEEVASRALTYDDRLIIQRGLNRGDSLGMIAKTLGRTTSTVREELRRILPKGRTDFDALTAQDMARIMSHVNSYRRKSIDWFAPIDMARAVLPADLLDGLGVERIEPRDVNLTPGLVPHAQANSRRARV